MARDIQRYERQQALERVASWDQHKDLRPTTLRQVMGTLVRVEDKPGDEDIDRLLELVGARHSAVFSKILPRNEVIEILGGKDPRYKVEDLIVDLGIKPVYAAFEYARERGVDPLRESEYLAFRPSDLSGTEVLLRATKIAHDFGFTTGEEIDGIVEVYSEGKEASHNRGLIAVSSMEIEEIEATFGHLIN
jgi:hypothetical protein